MSKGSSRRPTNEAAFAEGFDRIFRRAVGEQTKPAGPNPASGGDLATVGANPTCAANSYHGVEVLWDNPADDDKRLCVVYIDDATGKMVDEDYWP